VRGAGALAAAMIAGLPALGCASQAGFGRARPLDPGQAQVSTVIETNAYLPKLLPDKVTPVPWVELGVGYRRGIADGVELSGRAWGIEIPFLLPGHFNLGGALDTKVALIRSRRFDLAAVGSLSYDQLTIGGTPTHFFTATLPLLAGVNFGHRERDQLVFGPRVADTMWTSEGQNPINLLWYGGSLGVSLYAIDRYVMPELDVMYTPVSFNGEVPGRKRGLYSAQFALGISWDLQ
jgi:hypothetical protein